MRPLILSLFLALTALNGWAQDPATVTEPPVKGTFYVAVDDGCKIFVNGASVYEVGIGQNRSPELELKVGDRIVIQLRDSGDKRYLKLVFVSNDEQRVISFKNRDFKIVNASDVTDFTPDQFQKWSKMALQVKGYKDLPVKSRSEYVWGDLNNCTIACVITPQMIVQKRQ